MLPRNSRNGLETNLGIELVPPAGLPRLGATFFDTASIPNRFISENGIVAVPGDEGNVVVRWSAFWAGNGLNRSSRISGRNNLRTGNLVRW